MKTPAWRYVGTADSERLRLLANPRPRSELIAALSLAISPRCFHWEPRQDDDSYERAVFCGVVTSDLFDWFFNSVTGYRGAFFESPDVGSRENRLLVDGLSSLLVAWAITNAAGGEAQRLHASLAQPSAKMWLAEYPGLCRLCAPEWSSSYTPELRIENSRWERSTHVHSSWGTQAPQFTKIRVFGGFIDATHREWLASHKAERASHISEHGWS
jgi:hypothetical protein